ncbi:hypothetical protein EJ05DRAFT_252528 [Pseudovirgaria hyperparasitica]|uniref:Uncharacterized protein n=1 Tax=Pseudovirgaria hyperparasitica TaxID=470096 RepID=A0A6A6WGJ7_9PEZI|nr:uncharacterized protein EJ05DRAFT_252528 [Pseudovirgaria hyperparasitica]KAF2761086.1 hypothetical protein EJ05DRAFT_252528 [Pseudovirgaria hyperparasitica]
MLKSTASQFKEIRKEWKAKKKEEEQQRKAEDERARAEGRPVDNGDGPQVYGALRSQVPPPNMGGGPQLPPIGYAPASGGQAPPYGTQSPGMPEGMPHNYGPQSPYGHGQNQMYQQPSENGQSNYPQ